MNQAHEKIDAFTKVTLSVEAGSTPSSLDLIPHGSRFQFIFGLGNNGLSPFEIQLAHKIVGDEVVGRGKVVPAKRLAAIIQAKLGG